MNRNMKRRTYLKQCSGIIAASAFYRNNILENDTVFAATGENSNQIFFGDIHNHNSVGYGLGSVERAFDIAHSHLDFYCFTPHAYRDKDPTPPGENVQPGYTKTYNRWNDVIELNRSYNKPGKFATLLGYERHSHEYGHFCIIFPDYDQPLIYFERLADFKKHATEQGALLIPHHPGYVEGSDGAVPRFWDPGLSPVLEIFSEHGNAENDTSMHDYIRHSMGPRCTAHTLQGILADGYRAGVVASTDDHLGYPGAYGEGMAAVLAPELTREAIFDALRKRRTYGVTGDRILLDFHVNGHLMGEEIPYAKNRKITASVSGWDWLDRVEVLRNNRVIHSDSPVNREITSVNWEKPLIVRIEFGWGPMSTNQIPLSYEPPVYDWSMNVKIDDGTILDIQPCFQSGPMEENRRNRITDMSSSGIKVQSYTSRRRAFALRDTNAVVLKIKGNPRTNVAIELKKPIEKIYNTRFSELIKGDYVSLLKESGTVALTGVPSLSLKVHRLIPADNAETSFSFTDDGTGEVADFYYLRVTQRNGQLAWSSPIWIEKKV